MNPARKFSIGGAVVASTLAGGALGAGFVGVANAETTTTAAATATASDSGTTTASPHQANGITETVLTGTDADKATAAAIAAVPGATVTRVETDADGAAYEAHMTKADGTKATVKLDSSFAVSSVDVK